MSHLDNHELQHGLARKWNRTSRFGAMSLLGLAAAIGIGSCGTSPSPSVAGPKTSLRPVLEVRVGTRWLPRANEEAAYIPQFNFHGSNSSLENFGFGIGGNLESIFQIGQGSTIGLGRYTNSGRVISLTPLSGQIKAICAPRFPDGVDSLISCARGKPFVFSLSSQGQIEWVNTLSGSSNLYFLITILENKIGSYIAYLGTASSGSATLHTYSVEPDRGKILRQSVVNLSLRIPGDSGRYGIAQGPSGQFAVAAVPEHPSPSDCLSVSEFNSSLHRLWTARISKLCAMDNGVAGIMFTPNGLFVATGNSGLGTESLYRFSNEGREIWSRDWNQVNATGVYGSIVMNASGSRNIWILGQSDGALVGENPNSGNSLLYTFVLDIGQSNGRVISTMRVRSQLSSGSQSATFFPYVTSSSRGHLYAALVEQEQFNRRLPLAIYLRTS